MGYLGHCQPRLNGARPRGDEAVFHWCTNIPVETSSVCEPMILLCLIVRAFMHRITHSFVLPGKHAAQVSDSTHRHGQPPPNQGCCTSLVRPRRTWELHEGSEACFFGSLTKTHFFANYLYRLMCHLFFSMMVKCVICYHIIGIASLLCDICVCARSWQGRKV